MSTFDELVSGDRPVLVDFHATWCGPCKAMAPVLEEFKRTVGERARVIKVDVDRNAAVAQAYRVQGVPTLILFKQGRQVWRASGVIGAAQLAQAVSPFL